ncbi:MAG: DUF4339 domain-containing protein [Pirellulales bacterium]|nr:DUF4339 domain-containing protein [Pirellulales bacterium]
MGIRCYCPNQHRLNLKSFLAGKRCVCPQCGVKFIVPLESVGEGASPSRGAAAAETGGTGVFADDPETSVLVDEIALPPSSVGSTKLPAAAQPPLATGNTVPGTESDLSMWYVRAADGSQFGPAPATVFRTWLQEGRVAGDALVWREGWPQWRTANSVIAALSNSAPRPPAPPPVASTPPAPVAPPPPAAPELTEEVSVEVEIGEVAPHASRRRRKDRQKGRNVAVVTALVVALLVLVPVLIWVVVRQ